MNTPLRVGIVGLGRGLAFIQQSQANTGMELVALCDTWEERLGEVGQQHSVPTYTDFEEFLEHDMDAVILANYFHQHAPLAIKALRAGKHVMSETAACLTPAEGVALVREVERSGLIYMLADQYPFMGFNQEMRRRYAAGDVGKFQYGEAEYIHPMSAKFINSISVGVDHWRNWLPTTYYCSHALAPLMYITDTMPKAVSGFIVPHDPDDENKALTVRRMDTAGVIMTEMSNGALVKLLQYDLRGEGNWVRVHGNQGLMENGRGPHHQYLRLRRERFDKPHGEPEEMLYLPEFPMHHEEAVRSGHGGGDFFMNYFFAEAVRTGQQPYFDVYKGVAMAMVGIQSYRSAVDGTGRLEIPDFRNEDERTAFEDDHWSPDPATHKPGDPSPSVLGEVVPTAEGQAYAEEVWANTDELLYGGGVPK